MTELRTTAGLAESHVCGGSCKTKYEWNRRRLASNEAEKLIRENESPLPLGMGRCQLQFVGDVGRFLRLDDSFDHHPVRCRFLWRTNTQVEWPDLPIRSQHLLLYHKTLH